MPHFGNGKNLSRQSSRRGKVGVKKLNKLNNRKMATATTAQGGSQQQQHATSAQFSNNQFTFVQNKHQAHAEMDQNEENNDSTPFNRIRKQRKRRFISSETTQAQSSTPFEAIAGFSAETMQKMYSTYSAMFAFMSQDSFAGSSSAAQSEAAGPHMRLRRRHTTKRSTAAFDAETQELFANTHDFDTVKTRKTIFNENGDPITSHAQFTNSRNSSSTTEHDEDIDTGSSHSDVKGRSKAPRRKRHHRKRIRNNFSEGWGNDGVAVGGASGIGALSAILASFASSVASFNTIDWTLLLGEGTDPESNEQSTLEIMADAADPGV